MIKILKEKLRPTAVPENLIPIVFRCQDCGCTIRRLEATNSYVLMSTSSLIDRGKQKICPFCYRLKQYQGVSN